MHKLEGHRFYHRDPDAVFDEILDKSTRYGLRRVVFWDSNLLMCYEDYFGRVLRRLREAGLEFSCVAPEGFDYRLMTLPIANDLKQSGFERVELALESSDAEVSAKQLKRNASFEKLAEAVAQLMEAGYESHHISLFVIVGLPGQTLEQVVADIRCVWALGCNFTLFPFTPIPGTPLYDEMDESIQRLPFKALHPSLTPCASDPLLRDALHELWPLAVANTRGLSQKEHVRELITSKVLLD